MTKQQIDQELDKLPEIRCEQAAFDIETAKVGNTPERQSHADELDREIRGIEALNQVIPEKPGKPKGKE